MDRKMSSFTANKDPPGRPFDEQAVEYMRVKERTRKRKEMG